MSELAELSTAAERQLMACESGAVGVVTGEQCAAELSDSVGDDRGMASADVHARSAEDTVDGSLTNEKLHSVATAAAASEPHNVSSRPTGDSASPAGKNSAGVDEAVKESDSVVDRPTSVQVPLGSPVVESSVTADRPTSVGDASAKPSDASAGGDETDRGSTGTRDRNDASEKSRLSSTVGRAPPLTSAARHSLPSSVPAPRATGKHRLPPVLTHEKTTSAGQAHGLERISPLSLVMGPGADSIRASASLTGGTRLGDLGLSQPPLNLSVTDEAVNMKVVCTTTTTTTTTTQRSAADTASRAGTYVQYSE